MDTNANRIYHWRKQLREAWAYRRRFEAEQHRRWIRYCIKELRTAIAIAEANPDGTAIVYPAIYL